MLLRNNLQLIKDCQQPSLNGSASRVVAEHDMLCRSATAAATAATASAAATATTGEIAVAAVHIRPVPVIVLSIVGPKPLTT